MVKFNYFYNYFFFSKSSFRKASGEISNFPHEVYKALKYRIVSIQKTFKTKAKISGTFSGVSLVKKFFIKIIGQILGMFT